MERREKWNLDSLDSCVTRCYSNRNIKQVLLRRHTGGGSLRVWDTFSFHGKSNLTIIITRQDSVEYQTCYLFGKKGIFMQYNARFHVSRHTMAWLVSQNIPITMDWLPHSDDLNPIETICGILSNKVYG